MTTHASSSPARRSDGDDASVEILPPLANGDDWTCTPDDITLPPELEFDTVERIGGRNAVTPMKQRVFIRVLAETGRVCLAAKAAGNVPGSFYFLRNHARGKSFAEAWDRARDFGTGGCSMCCSTTRSTARPNISTRAVSWWPSGGGSTTR